LTRPDQIKRGLASLRVRSLTPMRGPVSVWAALGLGAVVSLFAVSTSEASYYYNYGSYYGYGYRAQPRVVRRSRGVTRKRATRHREEVAKKAKEPAKPIKGPLTIVVSIGDQRVRVFDTVDQIAESRVSTGMRGYGTVMGVFSVIEKDRYHHSNLYGNAPMPYMQRLTWSGTAMHTGYVPGYPASHGCIRLPNSFASRLWGMTKLGTRIIVARHAVQPGEISHAMLDSLKHTPVEAVPIVEGTTGKVATNESPMTDGLGTPMPGLDPATLYPAIPVATESRMAPVDPGAPPAQLVKSETVKPLETPPIVAMGTDTPDAAAQPAATASAPVPLPTPAPEYAKAKPGPIRIFISKKEGKLFVRKGFLPLFDVPIKISNPELPLGTHVYTATEFQPDGMTLRWMAVSLPTEARSASHHSRRHRRGAKREEPVETPAVAAASASDALSRVEALPKEVLDRVGPWIEPGASVTISDKGLGPQTGKGTGFIVLSR
jgi:lipoprotein-anchoring transpeptidase ErfK/SrfK